MSSAQEAYRKNGSRLPRKRNLGGGYVIEVKLAPLETIRDRFGCDEGTWWPDDMTIYILDSLPTYKRWEVYWHELIHAVNDCRDWDREKRNDAGSTDN